MGLRTRYSASNPDDKVRADICLAGFRRSPDIFALLVKFIVDIRELKVRKGALKQLRLSFLEHDELFAPHQFLDILSTMSYSITVPELQPWLDNVFDACAYKVGEKGVVPHVIAALIRGYSEWKSSDRSYQYFKMCLRFLKSLDIPLSVIGKRDAQAMVIDIQRWIIALAAAEPSLEYTYIVYYFVYAHDRLFRDEEPGEASAFFQTAIWAIGRNWPALPFVDIGAEFVSALRGKILEDTQMVVLLRAAVSCGPGTELMHQELMRVMSNFLKRGDGTSLLEIAPEFVAKFILPYFGDPVSTDQMQFVLEAYPEAGWNSVRASAIALCAKLPTSWKLMCLGLLKQWLLTADASESVRLYSVMAAVITDIKNIDFEIRELMEEKLPGLLGSRNIGLVRAGLRLVGCLPYWVYEETCSVIEYVVVWIKTNIMAAWTPGHETMQFLIVVAFSNLVKLGLVSPCPEAGAILEFSLNGIDRFPGTNFTTACAHFIGGYYRYIEGRGLPCVFLSLVGVFNENMESNKSGSHCSWMLELLTEIIDHARIFDVTIRSGICAICIEKVLNAVTDGSESRLMSSLVVALIDMIRVVAVVAPVYPNDSCSVVLCDLLVRMRAIAAASDDTIFDMCLDSFSNALVSIALRIDPHGPYLLSFLDFARDSFCIITDRLSNRDELNDCNFIEAIIVRFRGIDIVGVFGGEILERAKQCASCLLPDIAAALIIHSPVLYACHHEIIIYARPLPFFHAVLTLRDSNAIDPAAISEKLRCRRKFIPIDEEYNRVDDYLATEGDGAIYQEDLDTIIEKLVYV